MNEHALLIVIYNDYKAHFVLQALIQAKYKSDFIVGGLCHL